MDNKKKENKSLVPIEQNQLVKSVGNSLIITNKLLAGQNYENIIQLFIKHPAFFKRTISRYYPLTFELIDKYKHIWEFGGCLSQNQSIHWTEELIEKYIDKWNWWGFRSNSALPWSISFIDKFKSQIEWEGFGEELPIKMTDELINSFNDKWDWSSLSSNNLFNWSEELIHHF